MDVQQPTLLTAPKSPPKFGGNGTSLNVTPSPKYRKRRRQDTHDTQSQERSQAAKDRVSVEKEKLAYQRDKDKSQQDKETKGANRQARRSIARGFQQSLPNNVGDPRSGLWLGIFLFVDGGWTSNRWQTLFKGAWGMSGSNTDTWLASIKSTAVQLAFVVLLYGVAKIFPAATNVLLIIMVGAVLAFLVKNPSFLKSLQSLSK